LPQIGQGCYTGSEGGKCSELGNAAAR
jgi:hypothetical protein